ncbi:MAG: Protein YcaR in KDO2-Lipid A biosynthesis cluster [Candidatus Ruthia sp. Asou_11_S2]|nr:Protein YcaR in KDO2-Lipid A biosynthesis cluster [Candidatus Ruthia sp. Asou_11_S2]
MIDDTLLKLLVCPKSKAPLKQVGNELICEVSSLAYPIEDGIPILLVEEARQLEQGIDKK